MKRILITLGLFVLVAGALSAATATIVQTTGTVTVQQYAGGPWVAAYSGVRLTEGSSLSTGYGAGVLVRIDPSGSVVRLNQFTTVSVSKLASSPTSLDTSVSLRSGSMRAVVKSTPQFRSRFSVRTPVATASVRGTIPEISHWDGVGTSITYLAGSGWVTSYRGRVLLLGRYQSSQVGADGGASSAGEEANRGQAVGRNLVDLTPDELRSLMKNVRNRFSDGGGELLDRFRDFRRRIVTKLTIFVPTKI